jgi:hypothetical protein
MLSDEVYFRMSKSTRYKTFTDSTNDTNQSFRDERRKSDNCIPAGYIDEFTVLLYFANVTGLHVHSLEMQFYCCKDNFTAENQN